MVRNYVIGDDPAGWITGVLHFDWIVQPGADPG